MPNPAKRVTKAFFKILDLQMDGAYQKRDIDVAYRKLARTLHPDKGGTHEQFLALSEAYKIALDWVEHPTETDEATVNVSLSVAEALATLYTTISTVRDKLNTYGISENIPLNQLRSILNDMLYSLREDILENRPEVVCEILRGHANNFNYRALSTTKCNSGNKPIKS